MSNLNIEEIYKVFNSLHEAEGCKQSAEVLFNSVLNQFNSFEVANQQNLLNFIAEEYSFFSGINGGFNKIQNIANTMLASDNLGNQTTALAVLTKVWLQIPLEGKEDKYKEFINMLFTKANDPNLVPHLRNMYSQCLHEINCVKPNSLNLPPQKLMEAANSNNAPSSFSQIAYETAGKSDELKDFLDKRFWSMSPLESVSFSPAFSPNYPAPPNDPLLLFNAISNGKVTKDTALSLIINPFSQFGTANTIYGFKSQYEFDGSTLFTPFDNDETIANKVSLLAHRISTIENTPILAKFTEKTTSPAIISSVFNLASRFPPNDIFNFYRRYYEKTESYDEQWIALFNQLDASTQDTLRCFLVSYPSRRSAAIALLSGQSGKVPISCIESLTKSDIKILEHFSRVCPSIIANKVHAKLLEFGAVKENTQTSSGFLSKPQLLSISSCVVETNSATKTKVLLDLSPTQSSLESPLYGACFRISCGNIFDHDESYVLPIIKGSCQIRFEMMPVRIESGQVVVTCEFTNEEGVPCSFTVGKINVEAHDLLSPSAADFKTAWSEGEESLAILNAKFQTVLAAMNKTVIGRSCEREEGRIQAVLQTPTGNNVAVVAVASGNQTVIHFRAPSMQLLTMIDEFVHKLEKQQ